MNEERVLALDMSTKTGWVLMISGPDGVRLECYGQEEQIPEPPGMYPQNYIDWAYQCFAKVSELVDQHAPDVLVIEETSAGSKSVYSQKILEWIHFLVAKMIKECSIRVVYMMSGQWRNETDTRISKEESKHNAKVKKYKEKHGTNIAYDENGKRIGKITKKHVNIRKANEVFGVFLKKPLKRKDEDTADSLLLGYAYHLRRVKKENAKP